ncbi:D-alanyl-D-alanine carboxypeptidase family protein [Alkaliphilus peptidifermentans]|uniref:serine-type D-Ala-D-Ala carboxypeptidase n=1 Tax=Alkaliphilus peptidifermentans DSM 18978 TaxID=1120976 RepID=A0A1G5J6I3_9FIRM|nr:D-alanyl-D-alanine carboxypeptidase family protein [Alkaliphilus peptidifermentans]SCY83985.1 D-alanyl-D-alanine carboxypeptidase (penicillin-binding protein 5/6) [Alkaliphilus peptidifermentans DSM 18978]
MIQKSIKEKARMLILSLIVCLFFTGFAYGTTPTLTAPNAILMDYETGEILFDHNGYEPAYPASTTKVLTAILVIENLDLDEVITLDYDLFVTGSSMYLLMGESFTVKELLQSLLIRSANDVAELFANHISGSVEEFAKLMNQRAKEIGAENTHFTNPHGLPDTNHISTAYDLALIGRHAMGYEVFREIVSTVSLVFDETEQTPEKRYFQNTNRFLWGTGRGNQILYNGNYIDIKYDIVDGIKTGWTTASQQTLISTAKKNDHRLVAVVLGAQGANIYSDTRAVLDYGFDNFQKLELISNNSLGAEATVLKGKVDTIQLYSDNDLSAVVPSNIDINSITKSIELTENIEAPIDAGSILGKIIFSLDDRTIGEVNLVTNEDVESKRVLIGNKKVINAFLGIFALMIVWQLIIGFLRIKKKRRRSLYYGSRHSYNFSKSIMKKR